MIGRPAKTARNRKAGTTVKLERQKIRNDIIAETLVKLDRMIGKGFLKGWNSGLLVNFHPGSGSAFAIGIGI